MRRQLERSLGAHNEEPLYTPLCGQRLQELSQRLGGFGEPGGWKCLSGHPAESASQSTSELGTQKKRKSSFVTLDSDGEEMVQRSKRMKMDVCDSEHVNAEEGSVHEETSERLERAAEELQPAPESPRDALPEHIKVKLGICLSCPHCNLRYTFTALFVSVFDFFQSNLFVYLGLCSSDKGVTGKSDRGKSIKHRQHRTFRHTTINIFLLWFFSGTRAPQMCSKC